MEAKKEDLGKDEESYRGNIQVKAFGLEISCCIQGLEGGIERGGVVRADAAGETGTPSQRSLWANFPTAIPGFVRFRSVSKPTCLELCSWP